MSDDPIDEPLNTSRYQPGVCGNPKGRPKGRKSADDDETFLNGTVEVITDGKLRRITRRRLLQEKTFAKAAKGDMAAVRHLHKVGRADTKAAVKSALDKYKEQSAIESAECASKLRSKLEQMAENRRLNLEDQKRRAEAGKAG